MCRNYTKDKVMFKPLIIVSILVFVLAGCDDNKQVTEDMLVGEWECRPLIAKLVELDDGKPSQVYDKKDSLPISRLVYEKEGDYLVETNLFGNKNRRKFMTKTAGEYTVMGLGQFEQKIETEYVFISNNQFNMIIKSFTRELESKTDYLEGYIKSTCTRIIN